MPENKAEVPKKPMFPHPDEPGIMITEKELTEVMKEKRENPDQWREPNK